MCIIQSTLHCYVNNHHTVSTLIGVATLTSVTLLDIKVEVERVENAIVKEKFKKSINER